MASPRGQLQPRALRTPRTQDRDKPEPIPYSYGLRNQSTDSRILRNQVTDSGFTESKWTCTEFPAGPFFFVWKSQIRHLRIQRIHGLRADSAKNGAPLPHAEASPHAPPPRAGNSAWPGAAPRRGTGQQSVTADHQLAVNELKLLVVDEQSPHRAQSARRSPDYLGLAFAHIELRERYPLVLSPDSM
jgi:hypothetical protein